MRNLTLDSPFFEVVSSFICVFVRVSDKPHGRVQNFNQSESLQPLQIDRQTHYYTDGQLQIQEGKQLFNFKNFFERAKSVTISADASNLGTKAADANFRNFSDFRVAVSSE